MTDSSVPSARPRIVYVSYDGAAEPLGRSQVLAYLLRLADTCDITLVSFEKPDDERAEIERLLSAAGIRWLPRRYHRRPPVLSTLWDVLVGAVTVRRVARSYSAQIVHVRSYVPALMALLSAPERRTWRFLFDIRGFWADERLAAGSWREGSLLDRVVKACERRFFAEADAVVTLTYASVPRIRGWLRGRDIPIGVIPTCADVARFAGRSPRGDGPHVIWCGSLGSFYDFELAIRFAQALDAPFTVITRQLDEARAALGGHEAELRAARPSDVARELRPGDIGLCFLRRSGLADLARAPTRIAEYLASGMVVAATPGVGDTDALLLTHQLGVSVRADGDKSLAGAAARLRALAKDPVSHQRARRVASELYSVETGVPRYEELYAHLCHSISAGEEVERCLEPENGRDPV
ncbi:MAG: glycosyltransferase [Solirubrobacteraceae bacterium]